MDGLAACGNGGNEIGASILKSNLFVLKYLLIAGFFIFLLLAFNARSSDSFTFAHFDYDIISCIRVGKKKKTNQASFLAVFPFQIFFVATTFSIRDSARLLRFHRLSVPLK